MGNTIVIQCGEPPSCYLTPRRNDSNDNELECDSVDVDESKPSKNVTTQYLTGYRPNGSKKKENKIGLDLKHLPSSIVISGYKPLYSSPVNKLALRHDFRSKCPSTWRQLDPENKQKYLLLKIIIQRKESIIHKFMAKYFM